MGKVNEPTSNMRMFGSPLKMVPKQERSSGSILKKERSEHMLTVVESSENVSQTTNGGVRLIASRMGHSK